jgi:hypothetical protein
MGCECNKKHTYLTLEKYNLLPTIIIMVQNQMPTIIYYSIKLGYGISNAYWAMVWGGFLVNDM